MASLKGLHHFHISLGLTEAPMWDHAKGGPSTWQDIVKESESVACSRWPPIHT